MFKRSIPLLILLLAACGGPRDAGTAVYGTYEGVLSCERCTGIKTRLFLAEDGRYRLTQQALSGEAQRRRVSGRWVRGEHDTIELQGPAGTQTLVVENMQTLRLVAPLVTPITRQAQEVNYRLTRVETPSSTP